VISSIPVLRAELQISAMYRRNFKPKIFTDIKMHAKLFVVQILARYHFFISVINLETFESLPYYSKAIQYDAN